MHAKTSVLLSAPRSRSARLTPSTKSVLFCWSLASAVVEALTNTNAAVSASSGWIPAATLAMATMTMTTDSFTLTGNNDTKMHAIVYGRGHDGPPAWSERRRPTLPSSTWRLPRLRQHGQQSLLVRVHAVGINPVDAKRVVGDKLPHSWTSLQNVVQRSCVQSKVIGFDFSGTVAESSPTQKDPVNDNADANYYRVGDRVYGILPPSRYAGSLTEYLVVDSTQVSRVPQQTSLTQAAALPLVGLTALQCLEGAGWTETAPSTRRLLVVGASGGTGHVAVQVGRCLQPQATIVAVCSARNAALVQNCRATTVLDYQAPDFVAQLEEAGPFDVVMDCVTSGDPRDQSQLDYPRLFLKSAHHSQLVTPNVQYRRLGGVFGDWVKAGVERSTGLSPWSGHSDKLFWIQMNGAGPALARLATWMGQGQLQAHVGQCYPFTPEAVHEAFAALLTRRVVGKVVVQVVAPKDDSDTAAENTDSPQQEQTTSNSVLQSKKDS
jgi:NADPH:quinone reductase-like Zn-dependent oxidoreductase